MGDRVVVVKQGSSCLGCFGWLLVAIIGVPIALVIATPRREPAPGGIPAPRPPAAPSTALRLPPLQPGSIVGIARPGGAGNFHLAIDQASYAELQRSYQTKRLADFIELRESGRVFVNANGCRARVLGADVGMYQVHILDGHGEGREGWVDAQYVTEAHSSAARKKPPPGVP